MMDTGELAKPATPGGRSVAQAPGGYRPEIDGLRAVAVLAVVIFHAGWSGASGGYVGVDVFFVISGYLISRIIFESIDGKGFSFRDFYVRRIRRLLPAYAVVMAATTVAGVLISLPREMVDLGQSLVASSVFSTNVLFWRESGYFAGASEIKPLLHTWSLSVEEQFYVVFPVLMLAVARFARAYRAHVVWACLLVSLAAAQYFLASHPSLSFYLLPFRAWELLLGTVLALHLPGWRMPSRMSAALGLAGLAAILGSVALMTPASAFPGFGALLPCLGAAAVIAAGEQGGLATRLLSTAPMVFFGKISYSLYLWHWPILAYLVYANVYEPSTLQVVIALSASVVLATFTWRFVETPFRSRSATPWFRPFPALAMLSIALAGFGLWVVASGGMRGRFSAEVLAIADQAGRTGDPRCMGAAGQWFDPANACLFPKGSSDASVAVWGDSHALAVVETIAEAASSEGRGVRFFGYSGCPPITLAVRAGAGGSGRCREFNDAVLAEILDSAEISTVILVARHSAYLKGSTEAFGPAEKNNGLDLKLVSPDTGALSPVTVEGYFDRLESVVEALRGAGKSVVLFYPVPETGYDIPTSLALLKQQGRDGVEFSRPHAMYMQRQGDVRRELDRLADNFGLAKIDPEPLMCDANACRVSASGMPLYSDDDHLSKSGAELFVPQYLAALRLAAKAKRP